MHLKLVDIVQEMKDFPRSTIADWIADYQLFIPTVEEGRTKFYLPEAIDVLKRIRQLKELGMYKPDIVKKLADKGFALTVEDAEEEIRNELQVELSYDKRQDLLTIFMQIGKSMQILSEQEGRIKSLEEGNLLLKERLEQLEHKSLGIKIYLNSRCCRWKKINGIRFGRQDKKRTEYGAFSLKSYDVDDRFNRQ